MSFGVTDTGYVRKTFDDLLAEAVQRAESLFGSNVQTSESSFFGLFIQLYIFFQDEIWQVAEDIYFGGYVDTAEGAQLDSAVKYANIFRNQSVASAGTETFNGVDSTFIPAGTLVASGSIRYSTDIDGTVSGGSVDIAITAVELGSDGDVPSGTITTLVNPIAGITSVTNVSATTGGQDEETDDELRARFFATLQVSGKATLDAIRSDILLVTGVRAVSIIENTEDTEVGGLPPHSFEAVVDGGDDTDVAEAILGSKAAGIDTHGDITEVVQDSSGTNRTIKFSRPSTQDIWIDATLEVNGNYPIDGDTQVETIIVNFVNALGVGEDVYASQINNVVFDVPGIVDALIEISDDDIVYVTTKITIDPDEKAQTDTGKVDVTSA